MMAHVAEASESSGRVLLWTDRGEPLNPVAVQAAARLAASFNAEIETIAIGSGDLDASEGVPAAHIANPQSRPAGAFPADRMERVTMADTLIGSRQRRDIAMIAHRYGVACQHSEAIGDPVDVLAQLCLMRGPWNVVVAGARSGVTAAGTLFANVSGATGVVAAPSRSRNPDGPVCVAAEDIERLPSMLRAARKLTRMFGRIHVVPIASTRGEFQGIEAQARLVASSQQDITVEVAEPGFGAEGAFDQRLRKLNPSYVVSRFGGTLLPSARSLARTLELSGAPFLLVR